MAAPPPCLRVEVALSRRPGYRLEVGLELLPGVTVLLGPSGAGKSTTLDLIAGHLQPDHGRIALGDELLFSAAPGQPPQCNLPPEARRIGYVMQSPALFPHLDVAANLIYGLHGLPSAEKAARLGALSEKLGLGPLLLRRPSSLSGGEQQRVALGRALLPQPRALLLDEPLSAVDLPQRDTLLERLRELLMPLAIPVLYVTHSVEEQRFFASAGRPPLQLRARPGGEVIEIAPCSATP